MNDNYTIKAEYVVYKNGCLVRTTDGDIQRFGHLASAKDFVQRLIIYGHNKSINEILEDNNVENKEQISEALARIICGYVCVKSERVITCEGSEMVRYIDAPETIKRLKVSGLIKQSNLDRARTIKDKLLALNISQRPMITQNDVWGLSEAYEQAIAELTEKNQ